ncbi:hypothetical protein KZX45_13700 [Georgenia sp. EYE_87]|uniref:hypothetical protein n=1 Tax=Georgenia sp. EYE_87 TaxID=2853448 RepID=UPI0020051A35|nr:hypothetical protein [Georgenia sp. EYE_87]MCK6211600.1 hypothetical protein [Georgenia sp. EYE_87]
MPLSIDGSEEDPRSIVELKDVRLHYVLDEDAASGTMLNVFTRQGDAEEYFAGTVKRALIPERRRREKLAEPDEAPPGVTTVNPKLFAQGAASYAAAASYPGGVPPGGGYLDFYEHIDWGGCSWRILESGKLTWNLSQLMACGFMWWGWISADRRISCVDALLSGEKPIYILCDQQNLGGNWFWLPGRSFVPSLVPYGWNDRARSSTVMYFS